jgi:hypothetical protein
MLQQEEEEWARDSLGENGWRKFAKGNWKLIMVRRRKRCKRYTDKFWRF